jgi:hypothetical protein
LAAATATSLMAAQYQLGTAQDFFEHKFVTTKKPVDLADFYGTEDFMEVFCVLPFMVNLMMRHAEFDDDGTIHAWGLLGPGELQVSVRFEEEEADIDGDGELDTLVWFNKHETFQDVAPAFLGGFTLWEMTQNFGYRRQDDGTCEVYHHGEAFRGFFPMRLLFQLHSHYVIWATERYINSDAFGTDDREDEAEEQRHNVPLHVFKSFVAGLTREVERAKADLPASETQKKQDLEVTIRRLNTITANMQEAEAHNTPITLPRLRTIRRFKTIVPTASTTTDKSITPTLQEAGEDDSSTSQLQIPIETRPSSAVRRSTTRRGASSKPPSLSEVRLIVDDKDTKETLQMAMQQINASSNGRRRAELGTEIVQLARRTSIQRNMATTAETTTTRVEESSATSGRTNK